LQKLRKKWSWFGQRDMAKRADRIVIDTNLWISFLITHDFQTIDERIKTGKIKILFSLELVEEFLVVATRPKFKRLFSKKDIERLMDLFDVFAEIIDVKSTTTLCRDPKDNFLLSLAKDSQANFLITGDSDLLSLKSFEGTTIIRMSEYLRR
jgi:uncharacterized protein